LRLVVVLSAGIAAVSCGAILIRLAAAPALTVATYRVFWATCLLGPLALSSRTSELRMLTRRDWLALVASGIALALHFGLWIASLDFTSVASSVLLVNTAPFFVGFASRWILRRSCKRAFWAGLSVAFLGCLVVFRADLSESGGSLVGNALALGGALAISAYLLIGAEARQKLSLLAYVWPVYGSATAALALAGISSGTRMWGYPASTHLLMFLVGLVPQCIGHTAYNWSLRWLPPGLVGIIGLAEPVGASLLAYIILGEGLTQSKLLGGLVILAGIYLASTGGRSD
jgi:drug/metabolite transporter (DMT)-like permease